MISGDGRYAAFSSAASNLVAGDTNGDLDVFVHDRQTGTTTRVSVDSAGAQGNSGSSYPSISTDGRYVAFFSFANNLVAGDTNGTGDVFVHDRQTGNSDLSISKGGSPNPVTVGEALTYTITITNNGPDAATGVILTDTLPEGVAFVSANSPSSQVLCSQSGGTVLCNIGTLANGVSVTVTIVVTPTTAGDITNTASVTTTGTDPNPANNLVYESTTAFSQISPTILIVPPSHDFGNVEAGSASVQTFTITNTGNVMLDQITMTSSIGGPNASEFSFQNDTCAGQNVPPSGSCSIDVVFAPLSEGIKEARLYIVYSPSDPAELVDVTGTGVATSVTVDDLQLEALRRLEAESEKKPGIEFEFRIPAFISMRVPIAAELQDDPVAAALDFLDRYKELYRINEPKAELYLKRIVSDPLTEAGNGGSPALPSWHLFFGQQKDGIPVHGASIAVHIRDNKITNTSGRYLKDIPSLKLPAVQSSEAEAIALADAQGTDKKVTGVTRLVYYNRGLTGIGGGNPDPSDTPTRLAWRVMVRGLRSSDGIGTSWTYLIDANTGEVLSGIDELRTHAADKDFDIETANYTTSNTCWDGIFNTDDDEWFDEDGETGYPGAGDDPYLDGRNAFDFAHLAYDFYFDNFHRHSWNNGQGWECGIIGGAIGCRGESEAEVEVMVHVRSNWKNAAYNPNCDHLIFGEGYMGNDGFVHEYTHAVTRWSANLEYENESGALNESYSDVMAAMVDDDWLQGEDYPIFGEDGNSGDGSSESGAQCGNLIDDDGDGSIDEGCPGSCQDGIDNGGLGGLDSADTNCIRRDLSDPPRKNDPDHMVVALPPPARVICDVNNANYNDCGWVHTNSGIPNKAAYLLTEGGTHPSSGISVNGIGKEKVWQLYYDTLTNRLWGTSVFMDARRQTIAQAREYVDDNNRYGFTYYHVCSVINAFAAVGLGPSDIDCDERLDNLDADDDGDGEGDNSDNCPVVFNPGQEDMDGDGTGDRCDSDIDGDGINNIWDLCLSLFTDTDCDGIGDDGDNNGTAGDNLCWGGNTVNCDDNCPNTPNPDQKNSDIGGLGDACDPDDDDDGQLDGQDNCPLAPNSQQENNDGDSFGNVCDNCMEVVNDDQRDQDRDDIGDVCDSDRDGDGVPNAEDSCPDKYNLGKDYFGRGIDLACDADAQSMLSGNNGDFINGTFSFPNLTDSINIPIFPCIDDGCPDWIAEDYQTEVYLGLPMAMQARIVDDQGFSVIKGAPAVQQTLRFNPEADSFFRFASDMPSSDGAARALSKVSAQGTTQPAAYKGQSYFVEIYPSADVTPGQQYSFTIRVRSGTDLDGDISPVPDKGGSSGGGVCFIATAAYGSYMHPHVQVLRDFRDQILLQTEWGRRFVNAYYRLSPPVAEWIAERGWARAVVRVSLLPVIFWAWLAVDTSLWVKGAMLGLFLLCGIGLFVIKARNRPSAAR